MTDLPDLVSLDIPSPAQLDAEATLHIYQALRPVLPPARPSLHQKADRLTDCLDAFDAFILDGFGVINVGMEKIDGIEEFFRRAELAGKPVVILTNAASAPSAVVATTSALGAACDSTADRFKQRCVGCCSSCCRQTGRVSAMDRNTQLINGLASSANACPELFDTAEGFVFLGSSGWDENDQVLLEQSLKQRMRPVLIGNPDVSAPHPHQFSAEPGYWMARAMKAVSGLSPCWFGKPHMPAFQLAVNKVNQLAAVSIPNHRIAMVGDSHIQTSCHGRWSEHYLVTNYGLLRAHDANQICDEMQIFPDWQVKLI